MKHGPLLTSLAITTVVAVTAIVWFKPTLIDRVSALLQGKKYVEFSRNLNNMRVDQLRVVSAQIGEEVVISGTVVNQAKHRQPFPVMDVQLSNEDGVIVDQFRIHKNQYLRSARLRKGRYIEPNQKIRFKIIRRSKGKAPFVKVDLE